MLYIFRRSSLSLSLLAVLVHHPCQYHLHSSCSLLLSPSFLAFSSSLTAPPSLSFFSLLVLFYSPSLALFFLGLPLLYASLGTSSCPSVTLVTLIFLLFLHLRPLLRSSSLSFLNHPALTIFILHPSLLSTSFFPLLRYPYPPLTRRNNLLLSLPSFPPHHHHPSLFPVFHLAPLPHPPVFTSPPPSPSRLHLAPSLLSPMGPLRRGREVSQVPGGSHEAQRSPCSMRHGRAPHTPGRCRGEGVAAGKMGCGMCGVGRWARDRQMVG